MHLLSLALLSGVLAATATLVPVSSQDPLNNTISAYTDPVLQAIAADPPQSTSWAAVNFTNGKRTLPGAYFRFTEYAGLTSNNLTTVEIDLAFPSNLSTTNNIFAYHVHANPVAAGDDTCESAGPHYDPFHANGTEGLAIPVPGEDNPLYNPTPSNLSSYQIGDLAGKWGFLTTPNGAVAPRIVYDNYLRLTGNYSIVGLAIVVHDAPTNTRIACGNITLLSSGSSFATSTVSPSSTSTSTASGSKSTSAALSVVVQQARVIVTVALVALAMAML